MNDFELQRDLRKLAGERMPEADLWPAIAARLVPRVEARRPHRRVLPFAAAAALLVAMGAGFLAHRPAPAPQPVAETRADETMRWSTRGIERIARSRGSDPRVLDANIVLDAAQQELAQALEQRPDAVFLVSLLNRTHAQRMKLDRFTARAG